MNDTTNDPLFKLHDQVIRAHADVQHIADSLKSILNSKTVSVSKEARKALVLADSAIVKLRQASLTLSMNPASLLGSIGGRKTAERGPDYFRKIAAMRKTRAGGRPRKES